MKKLGFGVLQNWHGRVIRSHGRVNPYRRTWHGRVTSPVQQKCIFTFSRI